MFKCLSFFDNSISVLILVLYYFGFFIYFYYLKSGYRSNSLSKRLEFSISYFAVISYYYFYTVIPDLNMKD